MSIKNEVGKRIILISFIFVLLMSMLFYPLKLINSLPDNEKEDITKNNPIWIRTEVTDMYVWGNRLFVSTSYSVFICDIEDISSPEILSRLDYVNSSILKVLGNDEYLYVYHSDFSKIYEINDPYNPIEIINSNNGIWEGYFDIYRAWDVIQYNYGEQRYHIESFTSQSIRVANYTDFFNQSSFSMLNSKDYFINTTGHYIGVHVNLTSLIGCIQFENSTYNGIGLVKYDITNITNPMIQLNVSGVFNDYIHVPCRIATHEELLILTTINYGKIFCFKIQNKTKLITLSNYTQGIWEDVVLPYKNHVFRARPGDGLIVHTINNSGEINTTNVGFSYIDNIVIQNDIVFISYMVDWTNSFSIGIYNSSNPLNMTRISRISYSSQPRMKVWPFYLTYIGAPIALVGIVTLIGVIISIRKRKRIKSKIKKV